VLVVSRAVGPAGCDNPHFWRHLAKNRCQTRVVGRVGRPTTTLAKEEYHRQDTASGALANAVPAVCGPMSPPPCCSIRKLLAPPALTVKSLLVPVSVPKVAVMFFAGPSLRHCHAVHCQHTALSVRERLATG
jgi:hypothetical protein